MFEKENKDLGKVLEILYRKKTGKDEKIGVDITLEKTTIFFKDKRLLYSSYTIDKILNDLTKIK